MIKERKTYLFTYFFVFHPYFGKASQLKKLNLQYLFMNTMGVTSREIKCFPPGLLYVTAARSPFEPWGQDIEEKSFPVHLKALWGGMAHGSAYSSFYKLGLLVLS